MNYIARLTWPIFGQARFRLPCYTKSNEKSNPLLFTNNENFSVFSAAQNHDICVVRLQSASCSHVSPAFDVCPYGLLRNSLHWTVFLIRHVPLSFRCFKNFSIVSPQYQRTQLIRGFCHYKTNINLGLQLTVTTVTPAVNQDEGCLQCSDFQVGYTVGLLTFMYPANNYFFLLENATRVYPFPYLRRKPLKFSNFH